MAKIGAWFNTYLNIGIIDVAIISVMYGLALLSPWADLSFPVARTMAQTAPMWLWALVFIGAGGFRIWFVTTHRFRLGIVALAVLTPLWVFITVITVGSRAPVIAIYSYILIKILWSFANWSRRA